MADDGATEVAIDSHESESESEGEPMYESVLTDERHARGWTPQLIAMDEKERLEGEDSFRQTGMIPAIWFHMPIRFRQYPPSSKIGAILRTSALADCTHDICGNSAEPGNYYCKICNVQLRAPPAICLHDRRTESGFCLDCVQYPFVPADAGPCKHERSSVMRETMKRWCDECGTLLGIDGDAPEGDAALLPGSDGADPKYQEARQLLFNHLMSVNVEQRRKTSSAFSVKLLGFLDAWINEKLPIPSPVEMGSVTIAASNADAEAATFAERGAQAAAASGADPDVSSGVDDNVRLVGGLQLSQQEVKMRNFLQDGAEGGWWMVLEVTDEKILSLFNVPKLYIGRAISAEQDLPALPGLEPIIWYRPFSRTDCMPVPANEKDHVRAMIRRFKGHIATDRCCSFPRLVAAALDLQKNNAKRGFKIVHFSIKVAVPGSRRYCLETTSAELGAWEYISDLQPTRINAKNDALARLRQEMDALSAVGNLVVGSKARGTRDRPAHILSLGMREALTMRAELVRELRPYLDRNKHRQQQTQPAKQAHQKSTKSTTPRADASESQSLSKKAKRRGRSLPEKYESKPTAASLAQQWNVTFRTAEEFDHQVAILVQLVSMAQSDVLFAVVTRNTSDSFSCTCMDTSFQGFQAGEDDPSKACLHVRIFQYADCHRSSRPAAIATCSSTDDVTSLPRFVCKRVKTNVSLRVQHHNSLLSVFSGTGECTVLRLTRFNTVKCETCKGSACNHAVLWQQS